MKVAIKKAWHILTCGDCTILTSAPVPYKKAKKIIQSSGDEIISEMKIDEISYYDSKLIVWEKGTSLLKDDINAAYIEKDWLFLDLGKWSMILKIGKKCK